MGRRKLLWTVWENRRGHFNSYDEFKESWSTDEGCSLSTGDKVVGKLFVFGVLGILLLLGISDVSGIEGEIGNLGLKKIISFWYKLEPVLTKLTGEIGEQVTEVWGERVLLYSTLLDLTVSLDLKQTGFKYVPFILDSLGFKCIPDVLDSLGIITTLFLPRELVLSLVPSHNKGLEPNTENKSYKTEIIKYQIFNKTLIKT